MGRVADLGNRIGVARGDGGAVRSCARRGGTAAPLAARASGRAGSRTRECAGWRDGRPAYDRWFAAASQREPRWTPRGVARSAGARHARARWPGGGAAAAASRQGTQWQRRGRRPGTRYGSSRGGCVEGTAAALDARAILDALRKVVLGQ